jgi:hypothetical protein
MFELLCIITFRQEHNGDCVEKPKYAELHEGMIRECMTDVMEGLNVKWVTLSNRNVQFAHLLNPRGE